MSVIDHYPTATAADLVGALRDRTVSAVELFEAAVARIERLDGEINAVVVRDFDHAREAALAADAALARGQGRALTGLPMTVKESYDLTGYPSTWGMSDLRDHRAPSDALVVQRLKDAGAVILGKTNVPPMLGDWQSANPVYGRTGNPHDLSRSPGGSSGGAAAALAAGYVALEMGSDIGGSIRIPAAFCGVFGHKPSYGLVPTIGHSPGGAVAAPPPLAVAGPLARSAADLALALGVVAGPAPDEAVGYSLRLAAPRHQRLADYRVLVLDRHPLAGIDAEVAAALDGVVGRLTAAGATVGRDTSDLPDLAAMHRTYLTLLLTITTRREGDSRASINAHAWLNALDQQHHLRRAWAQVFRDWDIVLAPAFGTEAFAHTDEPEWRKRSLMIDGMATPYGDQLAWAGMASVANLPSTAFPAGVSKAGLPIGLQAIGPYLEDLTSIDFAGHVANDVTPPNLG